MIKNKTEEHIPSAEEYFDSEINSLAETLQNWRPAGGGLDDAANVLKASTSLSRETVKAMVKAAPHEMANAPHEQLLKVKRLNLSEPLCETGLDTNSIHCPICNKPGSENSHLEQPIYIDAHDNGMAIGSYRGDVIAIPAWSECGHTWILVFAFHKGDTQVFTIADQGWLATRLYEND